jgi:hypothetical protein
MTGSIRIKMAWLGIAALCALAGTRAIRAQEYAAILGAVPIQLQSNERQLYPRLEDVAIRAMERLPSGIGIRLDLISDMKEFSRFLYSTNGAPFREATGGRLIIGFADKHTPDVQTTTTIVRSVSVSGQVSKDYRIGVNYYPRELYAKAGQTAPGYVIVQKTDIPLALSRVEDWIIDQPAADVAFAAATWGKTIVGAATPLEKARRLARALMDELNSHRGTPSDKMNVAPFDQYRRAMSGKDRVWCSNLADIFVHACNSLGIPARTIKLIRCWSKGTAYDLLMAEGHTTTEIFAADLNKWIWIDLTFMMMGMELPGQGPIHMAELVRALNDPDRVGGLAALVYDPGTKTEKRISVLDSPSLGSLLNYFKPDQTYTYWRRPSS